jgi:nitrogen fixation protein NifX
MAELTALQSDPDGQIGSGTAQVFNPMQGVQILQNAIQRQDQLDWHNKQEKLRRQQMEAAARAKAAEDEVVAKYEENKGELFAKYGREVRDSLINAGQKSWSNFKSPQKKQFIADVDDVTKGVNVWSLAQDEKLKQLRANPDNKYFNIPSSLVQQEADDFVKRNPNFYKGDFVSELDKKVRSNPSLYNWGVAGDDLMKDVKTFDGEINTASGTGSKVKFSQIYQSRKNPKTGILEPILDPETGLPLIDKDVVMQKINSNPTIREMTNNFIAQALPQLQQQFPNLKTDELLKAAEGEAINKMFRARGVYDVSKEGYNFSNTLEFDDNLKEDGNEDKLVPKIEALSDCTLVYVSAIGGSAAARLIRKKITPVKAQSDEEEITAILDKLVKTLNGNPPPWLRKVIQQEEEKFSYAGLEEEDE